MKEGKDKKSVDRGIPMMFVGYPANREEDSVRMWNPKTNGVVTTRDVIWMKRMFFEKPSVDEIEVGPVETRQEADDESVGVKESEELNESEAGESISQDASASRETRLRDRTGLQEPDRLTYDTFAAMIGGMSGTATELRYLGGMAEIDHSELASASITAECLELSVVGAGLGGGFANTSELKVMNYKEAMRSPDREQWTEEVGNEKRRFDKFGAVTPVPRSEVPAGSKIMTTTWAMKKKTNGKFRGRLNARGYEQVDGQHYHSENIAAPVTNANTVRVVMTL